MNHKAFVELSLGYIQARFDNHFSLKNLSENEQQIKVNIWIDELKSFDEKYLTYDNLKQTVSFYAGDNRENCDRTNNFFNLNKPPSIDEFTYYFKKLVYQQQQKTQQALKIEQKKEPSLKEKWAISTEQQKQQMVYRYLEQFDYCPVVMPPQYQEWINNNQATVKRELKQYKMP